MGLLILLAVSAVAVALPEADHAISQKGRQFLPGAIKLRLGEHITVVNDDGGLIHHAYIEASEFAYDSGDQEPGDKAIISFPKAGDFTVLCGIHPKMRLVVRVE